MADTTPLNLQELFDDKFKGAFDKLEDTLKTINTVINYQVDLTSIQEQITIIEDTIENEVLDKLQDITDAIADILEPILDPLCKIETAVSQELKDFLDDAKTNYPNTYELLKAVIDKNDNYYKNLKNRALSNAEFNLKKIQGFIDHTLSLDSEKQRLNNILDNLPWNDHMSIPDILCLHNSLRNYSSYLDNRKSYLEREIQLYQDKINKSQTTAEKNTTLSESYTNVQNVINNDIG